MVKISKNKAVLLAAGLQSVAALGTAFQADEEEEEEGVDVRPISNCFEY